MDKVMDSAYRVLKPGGKVIIIEAVVLPFVEVLERVFYQANRFIMESFHKGLVFMFSRKTIRHFCKRFSVKAQNIPLGKKIDMWNGTKPDIIVLPSWMAYFRCYLFTATKHTSEAAAK